jgi:hypothetical protein
MGQQLWAAPVKVAEWTPADLRDDHWVLKEWDVSKAISGPGDYAIEFQFTGGTHRLDFRQVALRDGDGKVIGRDDQAGYSGNANEHNVYRFKIASHAPGAKVILGAEIKGDGGTDSHGDILAGKE